MSEWLVACPDCTTRFRVVDGQLAAAKGMVRCGACLAVFLASDRLEPLPGEDDAEAESSWEDLEESVSPAARASADVPADTPEQTDEDDWITALDLTLPEPDLPELDERIPVPQRRGLWATVLVVGVIVLALQVAYWNFETAALDPRWRPAYARVCELLDCALPVARDLASIRSRRLDMQPHPEHDGGLLLELSIENLAPWPQPYPHIELRFSDIDGRLRATRSFAPGEYLAGEVTEGSLMPRGRVVRIALGIESPGEEAVNYQIRFH